MFNAKSLLTAANLVVEASPPTLRSLPTVLAPRRPHLQPFTINGCTVLAYDEAHARRVLAGS